MKHAAQAHLPALRGDWRADRSERHGAEPTRRRVTSTTTSSTTYCAATSPVTCCCQPGRTRPEGDRRQPSGRCWCGFRTGSSTHRRVSPMAVPVMLDIGKEGGFGELGDGRTAGYQRGGIDRRGDR